MSAEYECERCGIRDSDLPDGFEPEFLFERLLGETYCMGCYQEVEMELEREMKERKLNG